MSPSFSARWETWNLHSSRLVEPEEGITLLHDLAARVGTASGEHEYGETSSLV
jgi:hypothetical protein